ncbi:MAG: hypothetical protein EOM23_06450 [Candidatus Moranbacteria bacterium]|nr:hypothetical protein [Candidatus Moranbacteria bacterium]
MKTAIIWNEIGIRYAIVGGDFRHFDQVYLNSDHPLADELDVNLGTSADVPLEFISKEVFLDAIKTGDADFVIACGWL